ncbi:hypothetical protein NCCP2495_19330 [Dietzia sp. NCCP-2495]|uniref:hypothetical protein n=1 Tax=Dietzia sp. NCCP-2495 TaxID=2934675 RepID=UPI002231E217|nr:hypothetical protein [Dietzia sp. NCCP-2495]GLB64054.1 hypothetical protein NCCP2495_19330 [Dietzia sp. NCCP-2495]
MTTTDRTPPEAPLPGAAGTQFPGAAGTLRAPSVRGTVAMCAVVVMAAVAVRTWVAAAGWFYWDDLILHGLAARHPWPSPELLLTDHDGHLMPGGMALAWIAAHVAPLEFRVPLVQIAILQTLAGAAYARLLWVLLRGRPVLLVPLTAGLALPLGLPSATWWASALNVLPLVAALCWGVAEMVRLDRTGRRRHAVGAALATIVGLLFVEKAFVIPVVCAAGLLACWWIAGGGRRELSEMWHRTRQAWAAQVVIVAAWAAVFVVVVGRLGGGDSPSDAEGTRPGFLSLVDTAYHSAVVPTLAGGPWRWERWHPGPPMADPPVVAVALGVLACLAVVTWSLVTRRRTGPIWVGVALYPLVAVVLVAVGRAGPDTAAEIVDTLRYHAEFPVIVGAAVALALSAPRRRTVGTPEMRRAATAVALIAVLVSSAVSTVTFRQVWSEQPSRDYTIPLLETLRERSVPMLDQQVPVEVLLPVTAPANRVSAVVAGVPEMPEMGDWTTDPVLIDEQGQLHPAQVAFGRTIGQGPEPGCGFRIGPGGDRLDLDGPLLGREWVVQLNLFADAPGEVAVRLDEGGDTVAPVEAGLSTVYLRVEGAGTGVTVTPRGGVDELCIGSGPVGVLVPR